MKNQGISTTPTLSESMPTLSKLSFNTTNIPKKNIQQSQQNEIPSQLEQPISPLPQNELIMSCPTSKHVYSQSNGTTTNANQIDNMRVAIRIRPALSREIEKGLPFRSIAITSKENKMCSLVEYIGAELDEAGRQREWIQSPQMFQIHRFVFDEVFDTEATQEEVYNLSAKPAVLSVLEGYNSTIFAYGQTGTGKTFTMEGFTYDNTDSKRGIIPRTIEDIFFYIESNSNRNTKFIIRAAYLQIYNEMISDLLKPNPQNKNLNIREDRKKGLYVEQLSEWAVRGPNDIYALLERGASYRAIANTNMNDVSSRSHAVFMIIVEQMIDDRDVNGQQVIKIGKLNLVDLAGSERTRVTGATGKQLEESKKINKSLSALGNVINALTDPRGRTHIPYRDSKLTRLLENSLGGNCKTTMIATISPAQCSFNESLSTLNFAKRAKNIKNRPIINEDIDHNGLIHQYETELKKIRAELEEKTKIIASNERILEQKNKEEKAKNDAIKAYEIASKQLFQERDEKQKLEAKIKMMNLQMITGGQKIEDTPQFQNALQEKQVKLEEDFKQKLQEIEKEREQIEDSKAQVEAYNKLLYKQRDIMNNLSSSLNEHEEKIIHLQKKNNELTHKINETVEYLTLKNKYIDELESLLEKNKIPYQKDTSSHIQLNLSLPSNSNQRNKIYIPYEAEQNGKEYANQLIPLLSSEEKIKELNDIVSYKDKEITLLKRVSEKMFCEANPNQSQNKNNNNINPTNFSFVNDKIKQLEDDNFQLKSQLNEKNQMIALQRQENESLEEHYNAIEKMYHQTEKENLKLINIKENLISSLDNIIKKIDCYEYNESAFQGLRTDLVKVYQIVLDGNNNNSYNPSIEVEEDNDLNVNSEEGGEMEYAKVRRNNTKSYNKVKGRGCGGINYADIKKYKVAFGAGMGNNNTNTNMNNNNNLMSAIATNVNNTMNNNMIKNIKVTTVLHSQNSNNNNITNCNPTISNKK